MAKKLYEAFNMMDESHTPMYFFNRREMDSFLCEESTKGDFEGIEHADATAYIASLYETRQAARGEIERAAWLICKMLPQDQGRMAPDKYDIEQREAHDWVVRAAPEIAATHGMTEIGR